MPLFFFGTENYWYVFVIGTTVCSSTVRADENPGGLL